MKDADSQTGVAKCKLIAPIEWGQVEPLFCSRLWLWRRKQDAAGWECHLGIVALNNLHDFQQHVLFHTVVGRPVGGLRKAVNKKV